MDLKKLIKDILDKGYLMSLATSDNVGLWVSDVIFIYDNDFNLYWMSDPDARHSKAILDNPKIAGTITISNKSKEANLGIQFSGAAEKIEGTRFDLVTKHLLKRGVHIPLDNIDALQGDSWYMLRPAFIDIINEELWGYDKKKLQF